MDLALDFYPDGLPTRTHSANANLWTLDVDGIEMRQQYFGELPPQSWRAESGAYAADGT